MAQERVLSKTQCLLVKASKVLGQAYEEALGQPVTSAELSEGAREETRSLVQGYLDMVDDEATKEIVTRSFKVHGISEDLSVVDDIPMEIMQAVIQIQKLLEQKFF